MGEFISVLFILLFLLNGACLARFFFRDEDFAARIMLSLMWSLVLMMWLPAVFAFLLRFTMLAQIAAAVASAIITVGVYFLLGRAVPTRTGRAGEGRADVGRAGTVSARVKLTLKNERILLLTVVPLFAFTVYLLFTHVIPTAPGGIYCGQSTWGDMAMHLGFITSITEQKTFPPMYSIAGGEMPVNYPFLCASISSTFYTFGAGLRFSYIAPMIIAMLSVFLAAFVFFRKWLGSEIKAALSTLFFFVGGGFGFAYFVDLSRKNTGLFGSIFTGFYTTPTNFSEKNMKWVNVIADILIPQRASLFGYAILIPCLYLLYRATFDNKKEYFLPLGLAAGLLPLIHTHSLLILGIVSAAFLCYAFYNAPESGNVLKHLNSWFVYLAVTLVLALPQLVLFTFRQTSSDGFLRLSLNWANKNDNYLWFYIKNVGLPFILVIPAFLNATKKNRWVYAGAAAIFVVSELVVFQPNDYDNNKLLYIWYFFTCGLVVEYGVTVYEKLRLAGVKGIAFLAALVIFIGNISGVLTLGREAVSKMLLFSEKSVAAAGFVSEQTEPSATFLTATNHNNAIASLTGRNIFCGSSSFLYFHGINTAEREARQRDMFDNPSLEKLRAAGIDYVYVGPTELYDYKWLNLSFFAKELKEVYNNGEVMIFKVDAK